MGSTGNGAKAGIVAGIAYGVILAVVSYFTLLSIKSTVITAITKALPANSQFTPDQLFNIALVVAPIFVVIVGVVGGLILGAIYGKVLERIPGKSPVIEGSHIRMWSCGFLVSVLGGLGDLRPAMGRSTTWPSRGGAAGSPGLRSPAGILLR